MVIVYYVMKKCYETYDGLVKVRIGALNEVHLRVIVPLSLLVILDLDATVHWLFFLLIISSLLLLLLDSSEKLEFLACDQAFMSCGKVQNKASMLSQNKAGFKWRKLSSLKR